MKIEIDLDDIFRDEDGSQEESLEESIRRQVIDKLSGDLRKRMFARIDTELSEIMRAQIGQVMTEKMPELIDIMNVTYVPEGLTMRHVDLCSLLDIADRALASGDYVGADRARNRAYASDDGLGWDVGKEIGQRIARRRDNDRFRDYVAQQDGLQ